MKEMPMELSKRIDLLVDLGKLIQSSSDKLKAVKTRAYLDNQWFTPQNIDYALRSIAENMLHRAKLEQWAARYPLPDVRKNPKTVGLVFAGNIPLVGFHDFLCVFLSGHKTQIKLSDKDKRLFPALLSFMFKQAPEVADRVQIVEHLQNFDAIIATGSNNSARYFEHYFGKYPHIIRKNRASAAVLTGNETPEQIKALGEDVFRHFGLGCRNVSKLFLPQSYDFVALLDTWQAYADITNHNKYKNNYDYNCAIYLLNKTEHLASNFLLLTENEALSSPIGVLHYEYYKNEDDLANKLIEHRNELQCLVGENDFLEELIPFGKSQDPQLWDYADKVDSMRFLVNL